ARFVHGSHMGQGVEPSIPAVGVLRRVSGTELWFSVNRGEAIARRTAPNPRQPAAGSGPRPLTGPEQAPCYTPRGPGDRRDRAHHPHRRPVPTGDGDHTRTVPTGTVPSHSKTERADALRHAEGPETRRRGPRRNKTDRRPLPVPNV